MDRIIAFAEKRDDARARRKTEYEKWLNSSGYTPADDERTPDFATHFAKSVPNTQMPNRPTSSRLCDACRNIPIRRLLESSRLDHHIRGSFSSLYSAGSCELCEIMLPSIEQFKTYGTGDMTIDIAIAPQCLMVEVLKERAGPDYGYLRLCADPGK
jgi:hypothetical protein